MTARAEVRAASAVFYTAWNRMLNDLAPTMVDAITALGAEA